MSDIISVSEVAVPYYQKNYKTLNVNGNVKEIFCTDYVQFVPNSDIGGSNIIKLQYKFDTLGNITEEICILKNDEFNYKYVYSYDKMNNALKRQSYDKENNLISIKKDSLNKQGLLVATDYYDKITNESTRYIRNYERISDTIMIYNTYSIEKGIVQNDTTKYIDKYENGNLIHRSDKSDKFKYRKELEYKYDKNGNQIFINETTASDNPIWQKEYDENNREIRWSIQRNNQLIREILKSYDEFGNQIKEEVHYKGELDDRSSYYDILTYDNHNNWIKRERFRLNGSKISVLERRITYY